MIYEIRNYHFRPDRFEPYKVWAKTEAMPYLGAQMDVVGFWITTADPPEILGAPTDHLGTANVTWIIRWRDIVHRNEVWAAVLESPEWKVLACSGRDAQLSSHRGQIHGISDVVAQAALARSTPQDNDLNDLLDFQIINALAKASNRTLITTTVSLS